MSNLFNTPSTRIQKYLKAGTWDESKHPRAQDGKFTGGSGGGATPVSTGENERESGGQRLRRYAANTAGVIGGGLLGGIGGAAIGGVATNAIIRRNRKIKQQRLLLERMKAVSR